ncbi:PASTA domain-containing protein [Lactimicrobium massiliense]|uniref:PASTA domain-containing protein n=1 Tax=Lactimicrobium massiliense TaxID=2161814 RepID=UPI000D55E6DA|nr:PASTA domain-containing protein [Lactimicrobium massiliense]
MSLKLKLGMKIALAAVLTAGAGTSAYAYYAVNASDSIDVPDFTGKAQRIVEMWAKKNDLKDQVKFKEEYSDDVLGDCVISQSARKVSSKSTITFTLSQGPDPDKEVELPDFAGKKKDEIEAWFADNYFSNVSYTYTYVSDQDLEDDMFVSMDPAAGTKAKRSDAITVTLATTEVVAPDFSSMNKDEIQKWGDENGISITFTEQESQILNDGDIMEISVKAGDKLKKGDTVTVTIAKHVDSSQTEKTDEEVQRQTTDTNANGGTRDQSYSNSGNTQQSSESSGTDNTNSNTSGSATTETPSQSSGVCLSNNAGNALGMLYVGEEASDINDYLVKVRQNGCKVTENYINSSNNNKGFAGYSTSLDGSSATVNIYQSN